MPATSEQAQLFVSELLDEVRAIANKAKTEILAELRKSKRTSVSQAKQVELSEVDEQWGYAFGCDGLMTTAEASEHLAVSRWALDRMCESEQIRKGKHPDTNRIAFCRRSIDVYMNRMEV